NCSAEAEAETGDAVRQSNGQSAARACACTCDEFAETISALRSPRMAGFSQATLERIRAASDIVDIIGGYLPLKKAGANFTALCPFHKEKTPSFNVNPHKQIFHCFGCHKGGDVFTFVKEYENIGFVDAVRRLADRAKIPLEFENNPAAQETRHLKDQLLE